MSTSTALELVNESLRDLESLQQQMSQTVSLPPQAVCAPSKETLAKVSASPERPTTKLSNYPTDAISQVRQTAIVGLVIMANFVPLVSFGAGIGGGLLIAASLGVQEPSRAAWIPASYSLTQGAFVLMSGRLGAIFGHQRVLLIGAIWWTIWTFVNAFCTNFIAFNVARALSGIGGAFVVPNAVAILGTTYPPGKKRNISLGLFGAGAPLGGWAGALLAGLLAQLTPWKWLFVFMAILGLVVFTSLWLILPPEEPVCSKEKMDWIGSLLGIGGLILFNFVWNQAPAAGWDSPYEIALLVAAFACFVAFGVWEYRCRAHPIMPLNIWIAPSFFPLMVVVLFSFMSYGTFIWYLVAWQQKIRHWSTLSLAIGLTPLPICAAAAAILAAWLVPRIAAQWILTLGCLAILIAQVLIATMPEQQTYWPQVFPATIIQSFCPDFIFTAAQIIACNSVKRHEQGIAGSLIGTLQLYATSLGLGFAGIVEMHTDKHGASPASGYRSALYFGMGLAITAITIGGVFVRMPKDTREGWQSESDQESSRIKKRGGQAVP